LKGDEIEADLSLLHNLNLPDLWKPFNPDGPNLTLRMVWVRIRFLPKESALAISENGGQSPWSLEHYLLSDLWALAARQVAGKKAPDQHPWRVEQSKRVNAVRTETKRAAFQKSKAARDARRRSRTNRGG
jgi:hypothetical protein